MKAVIIAGLIAVLGIPSLARAAGAGNPAVTVGKENYGFTMEVEEQIKEIDADQVKSRRYLGKVIWGATDKLDLYARLGASNIRVGIDQAPDFRGSDGVTWGGGARLMLAEIKKPELSVFMDVQGLSYYSRGEVLSNIGGDTWMERHSVRYKWNEIQLAFFTTWHRDRWMPYGGFSLTNVFGNVERDVYRLLGGSETYWGREENDFREDAIPELILGLDVALGATGRVSGEIRVGEGEDVSFFIGLSQLYR